MIRRSTVKAGGRGGAVVSAAARQRHPHGSRAWRSSGARRHRFHDRDLGDPRPAGEKARERERHPHALRREAGRGIAAAGVAQADPAQRHGRRRPERQFRIAVDAQPVPGADFRSDPARVSPGTLRARRTPARAMPPPTQPRESEGRDLQRLHVKTPRAGEEPKQWWIAKATPAAGTAGPAAAMERWSGDLPVAGPCPHQARCNGGIM